MENKQNFSAWIGRAERAQEDAITPTLLAQFQATLGKHLVHNSSAAPGLHWCLANPAVAIEDLGKDGHPLKGGFLPPIELPRRMWASGEVHFLQPLSINKQIQKTSIIKSITPKTGRSGALCFVAVEHQFTIDSQLAIKEVQNLVYREEATAKPPIIEAKQITEKFDATTEVDINTVMLFRYSAMTFNGHRIHYDLSYTQEEEHYPDLVIHGPLQATLLMNFAANQQGTIPKVFSYRGVAPATGAQTLQLGLKRDGELCRMQVHSQRGIKTMEAWAEW